MDQNLSFSLFLISLSLLIPHTDAQCEVPAHFHGKFYTLERGKDLHTVITRLSLSNELFNGRCIEIQNDNSSIDANGAFNSRILFYAATSDCYKCKELYYRTPNVLQYKESTCRNSRGGRPRPTLEDVCRDILPQTDLYTMFNEQLNVVNCKTTFEGVYQFSYEVDYGGGGICDHPDSQITACQEPGSPYVDNEVFVMKYAKCPEVSTSVNEKISFICMGSWRDKDGNIFAAVANRGKDIPRERYRCLLTREDQQRTDNKKRWTMSRWAMCSTLKSPYDGPVRLVLFPVVFGTQLMQPSCNFPRNFTGYWFTTGEFDTDVRINNTHIYFKTKIDEFTYKEVYFTCQQTVDTRFLTTAVTVGKCEVDYVCFDFLPRHHNIIRWRMARPFRLDPLKIADSRALSKSFRQACTWSSFTIDRTNVEWTYNTFLLNPPAPVDCPVGGRYRFIQRGDRSEFYTTRIRGITERPRHMIDCRQYVSELKSCSENSKKILIDAEYCDTVDHTGRPIGEYDIADRELSCVGYWMEDMRSYLITYDEEDAVSKFRCWVYERLDWRDIVISRATRAACGSKQTAFSKLAKDGASLHLELKENERLFDDCPQRFNSGRDPYEKLSKMQILGSANQHLVSYYLFLTIVLLWLLRQ